MRTLNWIKWAAQVFANDAGRLLRILLLLLIWAFPATGQAQVPQNYVLLNSWSFDDPSTWDSDYLYAPLSFTNVVGVPDGAGGYSLLVDSTNPAWLNYNITEADSNVNLQLDQGSIILWFMPTNWSSVSAGGAGPGDWERLIEVGTNTTDFSIGWWSIYLDPGATNIYFSGQTNGAGATYLSAPIAWTNGTWHCIALTYSPTNSALYLDGVLATNGLGVSYWPRPDVQAGGFYVGSDGASGLLQAHGLFDNMLTYDSPVDGGMIAGLYAIYTGTGISYNAPPGDPPPDPPLPPALRMTPPVINAGNFSFSIFGWDPSIPYDIYYTTNLTGTIQWSRVAQGIIGQTNYSIAGIVGTTPQAFFVAASGASARGDGLTDGFVSLVLHLNPFPGPSPDGMSYGWKYNHGLNPAVTYQNYTPPATTVTISLPANQAYLPN